MIALGGLSVGSLLLLFAAIGVVTAALYVLKLRRRGLVVPFAPIWRRVLGDREASELWSRLKRVLSLLLQLVLIALLISALGDPRPSGAVHAARNVVVLIDTSASMQARDVAPSRIEAAKQKVSELIDGLGGDDRMLIAELDAELTPVSTLSSDVSELKDAVRRVQASDTAADLERGLSFARDSLRGLEQAEVIVVSDGAFGDVEAIERRVALPGIKVSFVPIGTSGDNVGITQFSVRRYPLDKSRYEALLELSNMSDRAVDVELSLFGDGRLVDVSRLALKPRERLPRFYQDLTGAERTLEARISVTGGVVDQLAADDRAFALMPERRRVRVLVVSPGNTYLEAALLLDEYLQVTWIDPKAPAPSGHFDVAILDGSLPPPAVEVAAFLYLSPPPTGAPLERGRHLQDFGFDEWDRKSPLLRFLALENVQVSNGYALEPGPGDHVVGASDLGPILVSGQRGGHPFVALGFDPRNSDLVLRVAWPLFLLNTIDFFAAEESQYLSSYRTGEAWLLPLPGAPARVEIKTPEGQVQQLAVKDGKAAYFGRRAGFYELSFGDAAGTRSLLAANLCDPDESRIAPVRELALGGASAAPVTGFSSGARREIWGDLLLAGFLLSVIEWITYHRRITV